MIIVTLRHTYAVWTIQRVTAVYSNISTVLYKSKCEPDVNPHKTPVFCLLWTVIAMMVTGLVSCLALPKCSALLQAVQIRLLNLVSEVMTTVGGVHRCILHIKNRWVPHAEIVNNIFCYQSILNYEMKFQDSTKCSMYECSTLVSWEANYFCMAHL